MRPFRRVFSSAGGAVAGVHGRNGAATPGIDGPGCTVGRHACPRCGVPYQVVGVVATFLEVVP